MGRITLEQLEKQKENRLIEWHAKYLQEYGIKKLEDLIVQNLKKGQKIPKDMKLKEYVDFLQTDIVQNKQQ